MELWSAPVEGEWLDSRLPRGWPPSSGLRALLITLHLCKGMVMVMVVSVGSDLCSASQGKKPGILYRVGYNRGQAWTSTILSRRLLKSTLFKRSAHGTRLLAGAPARNNANGGHVRVCVLDSAWTQCKCGGLARGPCPWQLLGMSTLALRLYMVPRSSSASISSLPPEMQNIRNKWAHSEKNTPIRL